MRAARIFVSLLGLGVRRKPHPFFRLIALKATRLLALRPVMHSNKILICIKK
jgi:hypothetical protein